MKSEHYYPEWDDGIYGNEHARHATTAMQLAITYVDDCCGKGTAETNPALVAAWMQSYTTFCTAATLRDELRQIE